MNRRTVLALVGIGAGVPGGYLSWNWYNSPSIPDGMDVDTLYATGNVFGEPAPEDRDVGPKEERHRIIGDEETAAAEVVFDDSAIEFVETIDFDDSYLLIVQTGMQTAPDLALEAISRTEEGLHIDVTVEHPWWRGVNDDLGTHSLLIRITDDEDDVPESVSVDIEGYV